MKVSTIDSTVKVRHINNSIVTRKTSGDNHATLTTNKANVTQCLLNANIAYHLKRANFSENTIKLGFDLEF